MRVLVALIGNSAGAAADRSGIYGSFNGDYRGGITFWPGSNGAVSIHTGNNAAPTTGQTAFFASNLTAQFAASISVGNATPSASGAGITFPATQSASSDANTLDDYEEGTWTPTVLGSSTPGTGTYTHQIGNYVKVGQMVCASALITITAHTGTGNLLFGGLPFNTSNSNGLNRFGVAIGGLNNLALSATNVAMIKAANNDTILYATQYPIGGGAETDVPIDTNFQIVFTITYRST